MKKQSRPSASLELPTAQAVPSVASSLGEAIQAATAERPGLRRPRYRDLAVRPMSAELGGDMLAREGEEA